MFYFESKAVFYKAEKSSRKIWFFIYRLEFYGSLFYKDYPEKEQEST